MVGVVLERGYLHPAGNPQAQVSFAYSKVREDAGARGSVGQYAGGVRRPITYPGQKPDLSLEALYLTIEIARTLQSWAGQVVVWRDLQGRVTWALLDDVSYKWSPSYADNRIESIKLKLTPTTQTAEV